MNMITDAAAVVLLLLAIIIAGDWRTLATLLVGPLGEAEARHF